MRKISIAAAILSVVTNFASAQSAVAIYGVVDAGLVREQGYNNRNSDIAAASAAGAVPVAAAASRDIGTK